MTFLSITDSLYILLNMVPIFRIYYISAGLKGFKGFTIYKLNMEFKKLVFLTVDNNISNFIFVIKTLHNNRTLDLE